MPLTLPCVLFSLVGGGDRDLFFASPEALAWVEAADEPGEQAIPETVLASLTPYLDTPMTDVDPDALIVSVTPGSPDNDKALALSALCTRYGSTSEAMKALSDPGLMVDEYLGCIY